MELKTLACSATGSMINYEVQEGIEFMGSFENAKRANKSSGLVLRLVDC
jgi:hypothetical protein